MHLAGAAVVHGSKTQTQTAPSSTKAEFCAAVSAAKIMRCLRSILQELNFTQAKPTLMCKDNQSTQKTIEAVAPTERSRHISIPHFAITDWKAEGTLKMKHMPGKLNPSDALTKPLGWVLHNRHARRLMGHFTGINFSTDSDNLKSTDSRLGEGVSGTDALISTNPNADMCHL